MTPDASTPTLNVDASEQGSTSSSGGSVVQSRDYPQITDEQADVILATLNDATGHQINIPASSDHDDAEQLPEEVVSYADYDDDATLTLEDLFGVDVDGEFIGGDDDELPSDATKDVHAKILSGKSLNGYHADKIADMFGDDAAVSFGISPSAKRDYPERARWVKIWVTDTDKSVRTRWRAQMDVGEIDQSEFEERCANAGLDPYPRGGNSDEEEDDEGGDEE